MGEDRASVRRTTVAEAAAILGISAEAVRGRVRRKTLPVEREGGAVYVLLEHPPPDRTTGDQPRTTGDQPADRTEELVEELRDRIRYLERQLEEANERDRENRRLNLALTSRIPELQAAAPEPPESPVSPGPSDTPTAAGGDAQEATEGPEADEERRPWWRRMFGE